VALYATPGPNVTFTGWSGACTGTGACVVTTVFAGWSGGGCSGTVPTCNVTISTAATVTATFNFASYRLDVVRNGTSTGTVTSSPTGINCGTTCFATYTSGTLITLSAAPAVGATFAGWSGGGCTGTGTCVVTLAAATTVTATFNALTLALDVNLAGAGSGTVTSSPPGISCGADCTETYVYNTSVTLTAAPAVGSTFAGWSGACTGTALMCVVSMTAARTVTATFN
jgi:hypothetical protein